MVKPRVVFELLDLGLMSAPGRFAQLNTKLLLGFWLVFES